MATDDYPEGTAPRMAFVLITMVLDIYVRLARVEPAVVDGMPTMQGTIAS